MNPAQRAGPLGQRPSVHPPFFLSFPVNVFVGFPELISEGFSCSLAGRW